MGFVFVIVFMGVVFWVARDGKKRQQQKEQQELEQEHQAQLEQARQEQIKQEENRLRQLEVERLEKKRKIRILREQKIAEQAQRERQSDELSEKEEHHSQLHFDFHFNYFYEERFKSLIVIFNKQNDWQNYERFIDDSSDYSKRVYEYLRDNQGKMETHLELSNEVGLYLMPVYGESKDIDRISKEILANEESMIKESILHLDSKGQLVGGTIAQILKSKEQNVPSKEMGELQLLMQKINYFVQGNMIIAYFKTEAISNQTIGTITDSYQQAVHFCRLMQMLKQKIEERKQIDKPLRFLLTLGYSADDETASAIVNALMNDEKSKLDKSLVMLDEQGQFIGGALVHNIPESVLLSTRDGHTGKKVLSELTSVTDSGQQNKANDNYNVYEWYIKETGEIFYVGIGIDGKSMMDKNDLFLQVKDKYPSDYRYVEQHLTKSMAHELKNMTMRAVLSADNVLTNIQVPMGYIGGLSSAAEKTDIGARKFNYLETPQIVGNVVEEHYGLLDKAETYDDVDMISLKKTVVPTYSLNLMKPLYFKDGSGNVDDLINRIKVEIQERIDAKIYKSIAKSANSVIITNDPMPRRVKELHDKGYKVFHMIDVIKFLNIDLEKKAVDTE